MKHPFSQRRLGEILIAMNIIAEEQLTNALDEGEGRLGERLLKSNIISEEQLITALAEQFHMEYVDLDKHVIPSALFDLIPASVAYQLNVVPYKRTNNTLHAVVSDPFDLNIADKLENITGLSIELLLSTDKKISSTLKSSEGRTEVLRNVSEDFRTVIIKENEDGVEETIDIEEIDDSSAPVVKLINTILLAALQKRASDIHIETFLHGIIIKYRVDGVLYPATERLDIRHQNAMISRLKVMAELDIAERRVPQDGRFKLRITGRDIDFRVSILPSIYGEDIVIRILDKSSISEGTHRLSLENLGMEEEILKRFRKSIYEPYGMILITGPTGSGKTTTLYGALTELNSGEEKIITIEDPVEYQLDGIVQIPVNEKKNLTFAKGLRSILRHDPDKIMVGEIRDEETAQIAVQSALTGHLVFTTVHANNAFDVISRFTHMGIDVHNFVSALNCVMAQRLIRKICTKCKYPTTVSSQVLELSGLDQKKFSDQQWYEGKGCDACNDTGYHGRVAITEFLDLSLKIREMIIERRPTSELQAAALEEGFVSLRQSALSKALSGETSLKEINRITFVD